MNQVVKCLKCKKPISFSIIQRKIVVPLSESRDAICYNKITKRYVGICEDCIKQDIPKYKQTQCK